MASTVRRNGTIATAGTGIGQLARRPIPITIGSMSTGRTGVTTITNMVPPAGTDIDASLEDLGWLRLYAKTHLGRARTGGRHQCRPPADVTQSFSYLLRRIVSMAPRPASGQPLSFATGFFDPEVPGLPAMPSLDRANRALCREPTVAQEVRHSER